MMIMTCDVTRHLSFVFSLTVVLFPSDVTWLITVRTQNSPWVLGTLIYGGVKLEIWEDYSYKTNEMH